MCNTTCICLLYTCSPGKDTHTAYSAQFVCTQRHVHALVHLPDLLCNFLRQKQCCPIKGSCFANKLYLFIEQLEPHVLALKCRPAGMWDCGA